MSVYERSISNRHMLHLRESSSQKREREIHTKTHSLACLFIFKPYDISAASRCARPIRVHFNRLLILLISSHSPFLFTTDTFTHCLMTRCCTQFYFYTFLNFFFLSIAINKCCRRCNVLKRSK
jgi:hypothetical protein